MFFKIKSSFSKSGKNLSNDLEKIGIYKRFTSIISSLISPQKQYIEAFLNSKSNAVGVVKFSLFWLFGMRISYLNLIIVDNTKRGFGIGKKLFGKTLNNIKSRGSKFVILSSHHKRIESHNMYKSFGFKYINLGIGKVFYKFL